MKPKVRALTALSLICGAAALGIFSCDNNGEKEMLMDEVKSTQARLDEVKEQLVQEQARAREELEAERHRASDKANELELRLEGTEGDFLIAVAVAFSCVLAIFLFLGLLLREQRSRKALVSFLKWIQRRCANGKTQG